MFPEADATGSGAAVAIGTVPADAAAAPVAEVAPPEPAVAAAAEGGFTGNPCLQP